MLRRNQKDLYNDETRSHLLQLVPTPPENLVDKHGVGSPSPDPDSVQYVAQPFPSELRDVGTMVPSPDGSLLALVRARTSASRLPSGEGTIVPTSRNSDGKGCATYCTESGSGDGLPTPCLSTRFSGGVGTSCRRCDRVSSLYRSFWLRRSMTFGRLASSPCSKNPPAIVGIAASSA